MTTIVRKNRNREDVMVRQPQAFHEDQVALEAARILQYMDALCDASFSQAARGLFGLFGIPGQQRALTRQEIEYSYIVSWIFQKICDDLPDLAIKESGSAFIKDPKFGKDDVTWINNRVDDLEILDEFKLAAQLARRLGGTALVMNIDDGRPPSMPVNMKRPGEIIELDLKNKYEIQPAIGQSTIKPQLYQLHSWDYNESQTIKDGLIHVSRLLIFESGPKLCSNLGYYTDGTYGWTPSFLERLRKPIDRYESGMDEMLRLVMKHSMLKHGIKGIGGAAEKNSSKDFQKFYATTMKRIKSNLQAADNSGYALYDLDTEDLDFINRNLSGIAEIVKTFKDDLIGASGYTPAMLFNEHGSGMNAGVANKSVENVEADIGQSFQSSRLTRNMNKILKILAEEKDSPVRNQKSRPKWQWNPISKPDTTQQAEALKLTADADASNIASGIYTPDEARSRHGKPEINFTINLVGDKAPGPPIPPTPNVKSEASDKPETPKEENGTPPG